MADVSRRVVRTACPAHCARNACGINATVEGGRVIKLGPADFPDPDLRRVCLRGLSTLQSLYHPDRIKYPLKRAGERGEGKWQRISWDEALDTIAARLTGIAGEHGARSVGFVMGGPGSGNVKFGAYTRFCSLFQGTRVSAWGYGDSAGPCATTAMYGAHAPEGFIAGAAEPKLDIAWGTNPGESAPFRMRELLDHKQQGARLVVIDPVFTVTAGKADEYLRIRPGTDAALALGMMNVILAEGLEDGDFLRQYTVAPFLVRRCNGRFLREDDADPAVAIEAGDYLVWDTVSGGPRPVEEDGVVPALTGSYEVNDAECTTAYQLLKDLIAEYPPQRASEISDIPVETIRRLAVAYGTCKPANIHTDNGLGRTYHGDLTFRAVCTLAALVGNTTVPGAGGHRRMSLNWDAFLNPDPERAYSRMGILNTYPAVLEEKPYPLKAMFFAFTNFVNQCANSNRIIDEMFPKLEFIVDTALFMDDTARYADIVLPVCTFLEFSDLVNGPPPFLQLQEKVIEPLHESRSDVTILTDLAKRLGFGEYFDKTEEEFIDLLLDSGHASVAGIDVARLRQGPAQINSPAPSSETPAKPAKGRFRTASGRVEFYVERLKPLGEELPLYREPLESARVPEAKRRPLVYVQVHSRFRHHSSYANIPWLRELNPEPLVDIHPEDAAVRNIADGDEVTVASLRGRVRLKAKINQGVQPGVINISQGWWFDDFAEGGHNTLTHDTINPAQDAIYEPNMAFNDVLVEVEKV
jgi:anaerobic dimethyl sulfoxide reductase subunit A